MLWSVCESTAVNREQLNCRRHHVIYNATIIIIIIIVVCHNPNQCRAERTEVRNEQRFHLKMMAPFIFIKVSTAKSMLVLLLLPSSGWA
jgi:hypothetical protein